MVHSYAQSIIMPKGRPSKGKMNMNMMMSPDD